MRERRAGMYAQSEAHDMSLPIALIVLVIALTVWIWKQLVAKHPKFKKEDVA